MKIKTIDNELHINPGADERLYFSDNVFVELVRYSPGENKKSFTHLFLTTQKFDVIISPNGDVKVRHHSWGPTTFDFIDEQMPANNPPREAEKEKQ